MSEHSTEVKTTKKKKQNQRRRRGSPCWTGELTLEVWLKHRITFYICRIAAIERPLKDEFVAADESYLTMDLLWADPATHEEEEEKFGEYDENDTSGE